VRHRAASGCDIFRRRDSEVSARRAERKRAGKACSQACRVKVARPWPVISARCLLCLEPIAWLAGKASRSVCGGCEAAMADEKLFAARAGCGAFSSGLA
jgi:hypothetical protein